MSCTRGFNRILCIYSSLIYVHTCMLSIMPVHYSIDRIIRFILHWVVHACVYVHCVIRIYTSMYVCMWCVSLLVDTLMIGSGTGSGFTSLLMERLCGLWQEIQAGILHLSCPTSVYCWYYNCVCAHGVTKRVGCIQYMTDRCTSDTPQ